MTSYEEHLVAKWNTEELLQIPIHFTVSKSQLTKQSFQWILQNIVGRYVFIPASRSHYVARIDDSIDAHVAFEDPSEAVFFELTWG